MGSVIGGAGRSGEAGRRVETGGGFGVESGGEPVGSISELNLYPVKSMKGITVPSWPVGETGLVGDRRWMVVDAAGRQVTQRELPRLCLIAPALNAPALNAPAVSAPAVSGPAGIAHDAAAWELTLAAPGAGCVDVAASYDGAPTRVRVWDDEVDAVGAEPEVDLWLSEVLERKVRLVRFAAAASVADRVWQRVAFPDSLPFLLIGQASLDDLNLRLQAGGESPVEMNRFRPNLVVSGSAPFAEDGWRRISIGDLGFEVRKACGRCVITTVDQATAAVGREPLKTLATYRTSYDNTQDNKVMFGQKLVHDRERALGTELRVGATVRLHEAVPAGEGLRFEAPPLRGSRVRQPRVQELQELKP